MKVACFVHFYMPYRCAGSETMLHAMCKALKDKGHEVIVYATVLPEAPPYYEYEDIPVHVTNVVYAKQMIEAWSPDVIISHHDNTDRAARIHQRTGIPFVFLMHNDFPETQTKLDYKPNLVVFNTDWMASKFKGKTTNHMVLHPPVFPDQHRTIPGECVTLVNLSENKGANVFYELARRMPEIQFLGVEGGHGPQIIRNDLPNVTIQEQTPYMKRDVWSRTKILLMPSIYESYGMAGAEALASGIPVLAHPTPGLIESQGPFGHYIDRDNIDQYQSVIQKYYDSDISYNAASGLARKRSQELDPTPELALWVRKIEELGDARID